MCRSCARACVREIPVDTAGCDEQHDEEGEECCVDQNGKEKPEQNDKLEQYATREESEMAK